MKQPVHNASDMSDVDMTELMSLSDERVSVCRCAAETDSVINLSPCLLKTETLLMSFGANIGDGERAKLLNLMIFDLQL